MVAAANNDLPSLFCPAEPKYFEMFAAGKDVVSGDLQLHLEGVTIQEKELREYVPRSHETSIYAHA